MIMNENQKEILLTWVRSRQVSETITVNAFKRESIRIFNDMVIAMTQLFYKETEISAKVVEEFLKQKYFTSKEATKRQMDRIIGQKVFEYDPISKTFRLPLFLVETLLQKEEQKEELIK